MAGIQGTIEELGYWYHRIDLGNGVITPGDRNQSLVFDLYKDRLPADFSGMTVLDLGANACGLSIEFARRGAHVLAIESQQRYIEQAHFVIGELGLSDRIEIRQGDVFETYRLGQFDIVCFVGLAYHIRHMQLALDMMSWAAKDWLITSCQTRANKQWLMFNRGEDRNVLSGWHPTESLYAAMVKSAGFRDVELISTKPHVGESSGNVCGNRSYYLARFKSKRPLPFPT